MLKCKIIFKGQEFADAAAFAEFVKANGTEVFLSVTDTTVPSTESLAAIERAHSSGEVLSFSGDEIWEMDQTIASNGLKNLTENQWGHGATRTPYGKEGLARLEEALSGTTKFTGDFGPIAGTKLAETNKYPNAWEGGRFIITRNDDKFYTTSGALNIEGIEIIINRSFEPYAKYIATKYPSIIFKNAFGEVVTPDVDLSSELAKIIAEKYSEKGEDSVAEMFTKMRYEKAAREGKLEKGAPATLEYVTQEDIDKYLYPEGQAQDYVTQSRIHANTYAGVKATGISANFSKMLAYLFSATPVIELTDTSTGVSYSVDTSNEEGNKALNKLKTENSANSLKDLLRKNRNLKISKRGEPMVKEKFRLIMNNHTFNGLSRNELNRDGTVKKLFKGIAGRELVINVFETIDTIINLAIDNVKEQKLFILGLTNSNANAMMTALSFGAPLNDVARLFNTDAIVQESKGGRIKADKLMAKIKKALEEDITAEDIKEYLLFTGQTALYDAFVVTAVNSSDKASIGLYKHIHKIGTDSAVLDGIYTGDPLMMKYKAMSDVAALATLAKLVDMGNETFAYSRIFSLLRKMPSKKYNMDAIADMPLKYTDFKQVAVINADVKEQVKATLEKNFMESEEYTKLPTKEAKDAAVEELKKELDKPNAIYSEELKREQRNWRLNRLSRNQLAQLMTPSAYSVFENVTILSIPHVYTSWKMLNNLIRVVEQTFAMHSPRVAQLAKNVISKLKTDDAWTSAEFQETIQNNFIKFLTSNLKVEIDGDLHDMAVDPNLTFTSSLGITFSGEEAWTQKFISEISPKLGTGASNKLLASIEEKTERPSANDKAKITSKKLMITADKVGDDEVLEILKRDFLALDKETQIGLFKYALITSGLYYGRTNFSLIFPVNFALGFDKALNARLETVITTSNIKTDINMRVIEDQFLYQFVRNNSNILSYISRLQPIVSSEQKTISGNTRRIFHGVDRPIYRGLQDSTIYYDLKFPKVEGIYYDSIIRRYGSETYIKLWTPPEETQFVYYRVFTVPLADKTYSFDDADLDIGLDLDRITHPGIALITNYRKIGKDVIQIYTSQADHAVGDLIYLNPNVTKLTELKAYEVKTVEEDKVSGSTQTITYRLIPKPERNIDLSHKKLVQELKDRPYYAEIGTSSASAEVVTSQKEAILRANKKGTLSVVGTLTNPIPGVYSIDMTKSIEDIIVAVQNIPKSKKYVIDKTFIDTMFSTRPKEAVKVATALYAATGFEHSLVGKDEQDIEIQIKIDRAFRISDITATKLREGQTIPAPVGGLFEMRDEQFARPNTIKQGTIVYLGKKDSGQDVFGHVVNVEQGVVKLSLLDSAIFDYLSKRFYSVEELDQIKQKITC